MCLHDVLAVYIYDLSLLNRLEIDDKWCSSDPCYKTARNEAEGDVYRFTFFLTKVGVNSNSLSNL